MIKKALSLTTFSIFTFSVMLSVMFTTADNLKNYIEYKNAREKGQLVEYRLTDRNFHKESMRSRSPDAGWRATDPDPQLIYTEQMLFTGVEFYMDYVIYPGEMLLYYSTPQSDVYSNDKMAVITPIKGREGWYRVSLPLTEITSFRIDPTTVAGNHLVFGDFVVNPQKTLADYLALDGYTVLSITIYSVVLFAVFSFIKDFFTKISK